VARQARVGVALSSFDPRRPVLLTLRVTSLKRSLAFWHEALTIPVKLRLPGYAELQCETILVALREASGDWSRATIAWECEDLEAAREWLSSRGLACEDVAPPDDGNLAAALGRRLRVRDPDGNVLECVSWR
jgi:catechol 2,3-dioxygenase-like lactoylglutathione lyase family enzyme